MAGDFSSPIDTGLPATPYGVPDELIEEFTKIYNAIRTLHQEISKYIGLGVLDPNNYLNSVSPLFAESLQIQRMSPIILQASAAINAGALVNCHLSGGVLKVRHADATALATRAHGFCPGPININDRGIVYLWSGYNPNYAALAVGTTYYLSNITPGGILLAPPLVVGTIRQEIGFALTPTEMATRISTPIVN